MRSVFVHLWNTSEGDVAGWLDAHGLRDSPGPGWCVMHNADRCLYVGIYRDGPIELEDWHALFTDRGGPPAVSVIADISGRHEGWPETQAFVTDLLGRFDGIATDDNWSRFWSGPEVQVDARIDGQRFGCWRNDRTP